MKIQITSKKWVEFNDLGHEINEQFRTLYYEYYTNCKVNLSADFIKESSCFFSKIKSGSTRELSDKYFENFTIVTNELLKKHQNKTAFDLWNGIILSVKSWEKLHDLLLHKGTPYYFAGITAILSMDFDVGLILMHLALNEDKVYHKDYTKTPAYYFLTLNDQEQNQFFKDFVDGMVGFLRDRLDGTGNKEGRYKKSYQQTRAGQLSYALLRQKFLDNKNIDDEIRYFFVYSTIKFWRIRVLQKSKIGDNLIAPLVLIQALGGILISIESLLKIKYPSLKKFGLLFQELAKDEGWQASPILGLRQINQERDNNFDEWVDNCLSQGSLLGDFTLAYGLRNFAFHNIKSQQKLWNSYTDILQSIWNCFYKTIEVLPY